MELHVHVSGTVSLELDGMIRSIGGTVVHGAHVGMVVPLRGERLTAAGHGKPETVSRAELRALLADYALTPHDLRVTVLRGGEENLNLRLVADGEDLVLRQYATTAAAEVPWELELVQHLSAAGFPTPAVLRRRDGALCGELRGQPAALFRFVRGDRPRRYALWAGTEVAAALASLGTLTLGWHGTHARTRTDVWRLERLRAVARTVPSGDADLPALVSAAEGALGQVEQHAAEWSDLPRGAVHHDAHSDNVLFDEGRRLVALLDFDEAYEDCLLTDVARLLRFWAPNRRGGGLVPRRARRLLAAYERRRPLSPAERRWLPDFVLLTSLADAAEYVAGKLERDPGSRPVGGSWAYSTYRRLVEDDGWRRALSGH